MDGGTAAAADGCAAEASEILMEMPPPLLFVTVISDDGGDPAVVPGFAQALGLTLVKLQSGTVPPGIPAAAVIVAAEDCAEDVESAPTAVAVSAGGAAGAAAAGASVVDGPGNYPQIFAFI